MAAEKRKKWLVGVAVATFLLVWGAQHRILAAATESDPLSQVKESVQEVLQILKDEKLMVPEMQGERQRRVEAVVDRAFDFREMSRYALAGYWDKRSVTEQDYFVELFAKLVKSRYIGKIDNYSDQEIFFKKERIKGGRALIYTVLRDSGTELSIIYKLIEKEGRWLVFDMKIENVSLTANYRSDFYSIIKKKNYEGLVKKMEDKVSELATFDN